MGEDYGPTFGTGDTVGAGIHLGRQELFFTKNGTKLNVAHRPVRAGLYPTIGLHSTGEMVQVNFGQKPFMFDVEGMLAEERAAERAAVESAAAVAATADDGSPAAADDGTALGLRARLRSCLMAGDVDGALALLTAQCPVVLADAVRFGVVHFQLACQKYIELVRCGRVEEAVMFAQSTLAQLRGPSAASLESSLRDVVALVAYQNPEASPLAHLLDRAQRDAVADAVNAAVLVVASDIGVGGAAGAAGAATSGSEGAVLQLRGVPEQQPLMASASSAAAAAGRGTLLSQQRSQVELLLRQLAAVQGALHDANGGQGGVFNLRKYMLGQTTT
ncbi:hypothetical protein VOLCADRAFT_106503 [Volvox carteri f. nagariensis]|uniref:B30.2/SPRY domain-containing protein n=1 Tax=Volvox carteri f. nagariensis TaxID=3068 RepID=D8U7Y4_VOLCA|nr:uncharacterized protein VOLCADRAFT_106503 [Volvox carteri f. nagariensis]EFJ44175.1 hypothetical protein VOLCADRAFT_106503 [Volvox carteri f. nagariensis]|eukprot:XP_002954769.1 hypothetical protein VOLCADRAFT_106503 [Volvox carteri f. nagariensis]